MPLVRHFVLDVNGRVSVNTGTPSGAALNGQVYQSTTLEAALALFGPTSDTLKAAFVSTSTAASDAYIGGFRYSSTGALRVFDATAGDPSPLLTNQGIAITEDNQVCVDFGPSSSASSILNGIEVSATGVVFVNDVTDLDFALEFADLGNGEVDTTESITDATPTFTRATTATTVLSSGLIGSVASGTPRSYYDPSTLEYLGYLAEGARTNLCLQSEDFATTWGNTASSESTDAAVAPDGETTADKLIEDNTNAQHFLNQSVTVVSGQPYTFTCWFKAAERSWVRLQCGNAFPDSAWSWFDLSSGVVGTLGAGATSASIQEFPNGWYRCSVTATANGTGAFFYVFIQTANGQTSYQGDGTSGIYSWGAQVENAAFASSYIPTTTAAVARNADVLTYPTTGWLNASAGTFSTTGYIPVASSTNRRVLEINDETANERIYNQINSANESNMAVTDGGVGQADFNTTNTVSAPAAFKSAIAYAANDFAVCLDGGTVNTDTSGTLPTVTTLHVGRTDSGAAELNGPIRRVAYFGARLSDDELQALTDG